MRIIKTGRRLLPVLLLTFVLGLITAGCEPAPEPAYADDITANILVSLDNQDYESCIRDFDAEMKGVFTEDTFNQLSALIKTKLGDYQSHEFLKTTTSGGYTTVFYSAVYSLEEEGVAVKVVFDDSGEKALVSGLWFDSPALQE